MASFATGTGTATFRVATPDGMIPMPSRQLYYNIEHRPYSNVDVIDIGGYGSKQVHWPLIVLAADYGGLEARKGETGTLTETSLSETATLLELINPRANFDGTHIWVDSFWVFSS